MADVVYVNEEDGKKRVMNNGKLYAKLLTKFKESTSLTELQSFIDAGDWEKAQVSAHTIKGVAANLSLTELYNQCLDVETQLKQKGVNMESVDKLKSCFSETLTAVEKVIANYV